jgi:D-glycero-D-manno-heptose 1,7-bisphosphate phosphatase
MSNSLRPAVLLDRDGVLNRDSDDFIKTPDELVLLPGAAEAVARLNRAGYVTPVITNQSGIGRGLFATEALEEIHAKLRREIAAAGGEIAGIYACPHHPDDGCDCRKPKPALIEQAAHELGLDLSRSWYVGDKTEDVYCGQAAGLRTILALSGKSKSYDPARFKQPPDHVAQDLAAAADWILSQGT